MLAGLVEELTDLFPDSKPVVVLCYEDLDADSLEVIRQ